MSNVYLVFRTYGPTKVLFLAACSSYESAYKHCKDNQLLEDEKPIYTTRSAATLHSGRQLVIENNAVI